ncbi:winged helix-turn-helix transcriptional regulator [Mucilaginibacter terrae]|uniref:winged helix-turn-helix transcriptional regulator n=1 Tax=Mucilaginibacter terrae TaxID=1955052 RepID=UPI003634CA12
MASARKLTSSYTVNEQAITNHCPILSSLYFIGGRWKINILWNLNNGINRFGLMKATITGISEKMLTTQLRELEADGFINREVFAEVPLRVEYTLTTLGQSLMPILSDLYRWGQDHEFPKKFANKILEDIK